MSKVKEHVFHGNKILEYPNGTFTATKFPSDNPDNDIISKDCKSLPEAKAFIRGEQHPREPKFTRLTRNTPESPRFQSWDEWRENSGKAG